MSEINDLKTPNKKQRFTYILMGLIKDRNIDLFTMSIIIYLAVNYENCTFTDDDIYKQSGYKPAKWEKTKKKLQAMGLITTGHINGIECFKFSLNDCGSYL